MKFLYYPLLFALFSCGQENKSIIIKGSDTEVNLAVQLTESFYNQRPDILISISGGGSGLGIASLLNGTADLANSSRGIKETESGLFQKRHVKIDSFVFAQDAIAIIVADDIPIDSISVRDLAAIFSGEYKNWSALTNKDLPINIYGRQSNSGTHDYIKSKLAIDFSPYAKEMNGNAQIMEAIKADHSGIGYIGAGYFIHGGKDGIKALPIYSVKNTSAVSPLDASKIAAGKYFLQRPLYQFYKSASYQKIKPFLDFENSSEGQKIIKAAGYYPVN
jgi:phosphate transport system substrate-binding protein